MAGMLKFHLNTRRPPAFSSTLTKRNVTLTFGGSAEVRQSVLGDWFIKGPISLTAISPSPIGTGSTARNGAMINPSDKWTHGYDGRVNLFGGVVYSDALNMGIGLPRTLNPGDTLICTISRLPELTSDQLYAVDAHRRCMAECEIFHVVDTLPPTNAFRPPYCGTSKPIYTTDDVNYALLGLLTPPFDPTSGSFSFAFADAKQGLIGPYLDHCDKISTDAAGLVPDSWQEWYPAYRGKNYNRVAAYTLCNFSDRNTMANRLIQIGIDLYGATGQANWTWRGGAGFAVSRLMPILYAGKLLNNTAMLTTPGSTADPKFGEQSSWYYTASPYAGYNYPAGSYPNGKPLYGDIDGSTSGYNHTGVDPHHYFNSVGPGSRYTYSDGTCDHMLDAGAYMYLSTPVMVGASMISRLLGFDSNWNAQASHDFADWWASDDQLRLLSSDATNDYRRDIAMSGSGNGFMLQMWNNNI